MGEVNGEPDVLMSELCGGNYGIVSVLELVVDLEAFSQSSENLNRLVNGGLRNFDWLESSLQSWILLDILTVLI